MSHVHISEGAARAALEALCGRRPFIDLRPTIAEFERELKRLEPPPSIADYDRMEAPEKDRPVRMRRTWRASGPTKRTRTKAQKRAETRRIYDACLARAGGYCECGCGGVLDVIPEGVAWDSRRSSGPEMDHVFGRGKGRPPQSVETCWILRTDCHREKTNNRPDAAAWFRKFMAHCDRHGFGHWKREAHRRLGFILIRSSLPAAPRIR